MTGPTLFDCEHCEAARARIAELEQRLADLEAQAKWMRPRVQMPTCERCKSWGGNPQGHLEIFGFDATICAHCWQPGDELRIDLSTTITVRDDFHITVHTKVGDVELEMSPTRYFDGTPWSTEWTASGALEAGPAGGPGVGCRGAAVQAVQMMARDVHATL